MMLKKEGYRAKKYWTLNNYSVGLDKKLWCKLLTDWSYTGGHGREREENYELTVLTLLKTKFTVWTKVTKIKEYMAMKLF